MTSVFKFFKSFHYAFQGILYGLRTQRNLKIHTVALTFVLVFGWYFHLTLGEWISIIIVSAMVISAEIFNTAIEDIANLLKPKLKLTYTDTTHIRDLAAGAVLVTAFSAALVGILIFAPKFLALLN